MDKTPTDRNDTHRADEAPAEPKVDRLLRERGRLKARLEKNSREWAKLLSEERVKLPVEEGLRLASELGLLARVKEHGDTGRMLHAIQATARHHAERYPDDLEAQGIAAILTAISKAHHEQSNAKLEAERRKQARSFLEKIGSVAGSAKHYLSHPRRGPPTRSQEADALLSAMRTGVRLRNEEGWTTYQIAEYFVTKLRNEAPIIAKDTNVPISGIGPWRGTGPEGEAIAKVIRAIERAWSDDPPDLEKLTRAALKRLGYKKTDDLFKHRRR